MSIAVKFKTYTYPDAVSNNAQRGIDLNEKNGNKCDHPKRARSGRNSWPKKRRLALRP